METKSPGKISKRVIKIDDVAEAAGVSKATVSRVMNRPYLVHDNTVQKVKTAMKRLNYAPNAVAQSMRSQKTKTIGVVIPDLKNPFYSGMLCEIDILLRNYDYMMTICPASGVFDEEKDLMRRMTQRRVDGILHFTYNNSRVHIDSILSITKNLPFILMDESADDVQVSQVVTNGYSGVASAVEYLIGKGHKDIACICSNTEAASWRLKGYQDTMEKHGLTVKKGFLQPSGFSVQDGAETAEKILQLREKPTAIVCVADSIAVGAMGKLMQNGVKIPQDMEIIGFNNSELSTIISPALSTIGQNLPELASQAVNMLMDMIEHPSKSRNINIVKVKADLILRESTI